MKPQKIISIILILTFTATSIPCFEGNSSWGQSPTGTVPKHELAPKSRIRNGETGSITRTIDFLVIKGLAREYQDILKAHFLHAPLYANVTKVTMERLGNGSDVHFTFFLSGKRKVVVVAQVTKKLKLSQYTTSIDEQFKQGLTKAPFSPWLSWLKQKWLLVAALTLTATLLLGLSGYFFYYHFIPEKPDVFQTTGSKDRATVYYVTHQFKEDALKFVPSLEKTIRQASSNGKRIIVVFEYAGPADESDAAKLLGVDREKAREAFEQEEENIEKWDRRLVMGNEDLAELLPTDEFLRVIFDLLRRLHREGILIQTELENADFDEWVSGRDILELAADAQIKFFQGKILESIQSSRESSVILQRIIQTRDSRFSQQLLDLLAEKDNLIVTFRGSNHDVHTQLSKQGVGINTNGKEDSPETSFGGNEFLLKSSLGILMTQDEIERLMLADVVGNMLTKLAFGTFYTEDGIRISPQPDIGRRILRDILHSGNISYQDLVALSTDLATSPHLLSWSEGDKAMAIYHWMRLKGKINDEQAIQCFPIAEQIIRDRDASSKQRKK